MWSGFVHGLDVFRIMATHEGQSPSSSTLPLRCDLDTYALHGNILLLQQCRRKSTNEATPRNSPEINAFSMNLPVYPSMLLTH